MNRCFAWVGLIVFCGHAVFKAYLKTRINTFYEIFYDHLQDSGEWSSGETSNEHMSMKREQVFADLVGFAWVVAPAVVVHPVCKFISSQWTLHWRLRLTASYLDAYDVTKTPIEGVSQRIHEDTQRFINGIYTCFAVFLDSMLTLLIFIPILLELGANVQLPGWKWDGWLLFLAFSSAFGGLFVSILVSWRLVRLEVHNQKVEAALRKKLVILESDPAAIVGVEKASDTAIEELHFEDYLEKKRPRAVSPLGTFATVLGQVNTNYSSLFRNFAVFNTWIAAFDQTLVILPYLLVAPLMFAQDPSNRITLGSLTKTSNVFSHVFSALAVLGASWNAVNEWRSTLLRLREFEKSLYHPPVRTSSTHIVEIVSTMELDDNVY